VVSESAIGHGFDLDDWCSFCGVNPTLGGGLCSMCQDDDDFANCEFCHGTSCTQECKDDD
jgi:hypothetical protein